MNYSNERNSYSIKTFKSSIFPTVTLQLSLNKIPNLNGENQNETLLTALKLSGLYVHMLRK